MDNANEQVQSLLNQLVEDGPEVGLQVAAYLDGKLVIDVWAGMADPETGRPVTGDTLFRGASSTKGITYTCIHILADRGTIDYDTPICHYWPEFAANGKEKVTIRHALAHQAGIPQMPELGSIMMMFDWDAMCRAIADLEPLWEPGTKTGYHGVTIGWILGEVLRRVDGRPISQFVKEEICQPLGTEDIYIGVPETVESRIATQIIPPPSPDAPPLPPDLLFLRTIPIEILIPALRPPGFDLAYKRAPLPAVNGIMTARAFARHYAALAQGGEIDGVRILARERIRIATELQTDAPDEVINQLGPDIGPIRKGLGYWLGGSFNPANHYEAAIGLKETSFGHSGMGGIVAFADPEQRFSFAFLKNFRTPLNAPLPDPAYVVAKKVRSVLGLAE